VVLAKASAAAATLIAASVRKVGESPQRVPASAAPAQGASALVIVTGADSSPLNRP
jgi:hypothetical protein